MKILVLGAGGIGGYYGARLIEAGADVTFLVRPAREAQLSSGLRVESGVGNFSRPVRTLTRVPDGAHFDLVLLTCKSYDLAGAIDAVAPAVEAGAVVLPFLNGLGAYDALDARFGKDKVLGGVAYVATTLTDDGTVRHLADADTMIVGERTADAAPVVRAFFDLAHRTPGVRRLSPDIEQALWDKWVLLASGAAVCCLLRGTLREILHTDAGEKIMRQAIAESAAVAAAFGHALNAETRAFTDGYLIATESNWAASMMRDIAQGRPRLEADAIVGDMLARSVAKGLPAPVLETAFAHLQVYMRRHAG
ncbi:ketopantoate reductase family protein [Luteibacter aegosomatissinici]|uniref:ketopantoate reductase family protein n=1 Tax=Luteibacter aegosomatissinici TaxID=2911539 RepID=UPI001FF955BB|nr:2-dehydropantoate 2-reductase [Luteibacter aegosomatissinici]UPG92709.1 2-dehydropantoate 2-reductase [Luteibacter aegosomatissinici]